VEGLGLARCIARITYGCERELNQKVPHPHDTAVPAYLEQDGVALGQRFDANSYICLTRAMSQHDVGRARGAISTALGRISARVRVVGVSSDRLFPPQRQQELAQAIRSGVTMTNLESLQGHDGFLTEQRKLDPILRQSLG
jgi:homoserine O-acetyltransferase